jgi:hypothetical protein
MLDTEADSIVTGEQCEWTLYLVPVLTTRGYQESHSEWRWSWFSKSETLTVCKILLSECLYWKIEIHDYCWIEQDTCRARWLSLGYVDRDPVPLQSQLHHQLILCCHGADLIAACVGWPLLLSLSLRSQWVKIWGVCLPYFKCLEIISYYH